MTRKYKRVEPHLGTRMGMGGGHKGVWLGRRLAKAQALGEKLGFGAHKPS